MSTPAQPVESARQRADMTPRQLWWAYLTLGGTAPEAQVHDFLAGQAELAPDQYDILAQALNDRLVELGLDHRVPYADPMG